VTKIERLAGGGDRGRQRYRKIKRLAEGGRRRGEKVTERKRDWQRDGDRGETGDRNIERRWMTEGRQRETEEQKGRVGRRIERMKGRQRRYSIIR
jgi:hypothetical protein